ncbi:MAG: hypothetical protein O2954_19445, partial [bacterium]|nr:hypothetical protein [bacterium]
MLRRTGFWILCMAVLTPPLSGQTLSSLHQVLSSSSLIDRPQVFRDLQSAIRDSIGNVEPGLRLNGFYSRMSTARKQL